MNTNLLTFKWTVSQAKNTYGYSICTLFVDNQKVSSCNGGGYDMKGTALGNFLTDRFQERLLKLHRRAGFRYSIRKNKDGDHYRRLKPTKPDYHGHDELYGMTAYYPSGQRKAHRISLNGACGFSSMEKIAKAIGIKLQYKDESAKETHYIAIVA